MLRMTEAVLIYAKLSPNVFRHAEHGLLIGLSIKVTSFSCATVGRRIKRWKLGGVGRRPDSAEPSVILHCLAADQMKRDAIEYYRRPTVAHG